MSFLALQPYVNDCPQGWDVVRFKTVANIRSEKNKDSDRKLLALSAYDGIIPKGSGFGYQEAGEQTIASYGVVRSGDIVVNPMWALQGGVAASSLEGAVSPAYRVYRPSSRVESKFLHYLLRSDPYIQQYRLSARGLTTFDRSIGKDDFHQLPVLLPPLEEQRRIADFLDAETSRIDNLLQGSKRLKEVLLERRVRNIESQVSGGSAEGLVPSKIPWADRIPEHWKDVKINFVARMGSGHTPSRSVPEWWINPTVPWVTTGEVAQIRDDRREVIESTREKITHVGIANSSAAIHSAGTVVLSRTASAGFSAVMGADMATSQDFVTWTCGPHLDPYYLLWCLRGMRPYLLGQLATGSTHKTIYVPDLQALRIPLPPIEEQHNIVRNIRKSNDELDQLCDRLDRQQDLLAERKQTLITAAVTGQIDVTTAGRATSDLRA